MPITTILSGPRRTHPNSQMCAGISDRNTDLLMSASVEFGPWGPDNGPAAKPERGRLGASETESETALDCSDRGEGVPANCYRAPLASAEDARAGAQITPAGPSVRVRETRSVGPGPPFKKARAAVGGSDGEGGAPSSLEVTEWQARQHWHGEPDPGALVYRSLSSSMIIHAMNICHDSPSVTFSIMDAVTLSRPRRVVRQLCR
jgi:hypothetical protein